MSVNDVLVMAVTTAGFTVVMETRLSFRLWSWLRSLDGGTVVSSHGRHRTPRCGVRERERTKCRAQFPQVARSLCDGPTGALTSAPLHGKQKRASSEDGESRHFASGAPCSHRWLPETGFVPISGGAAVFTLLSFRTQSPLDVPTSSVLGRAACTISCLLSRAVLWHPEVILHSCFLLLLLALLWNLLMDYQVVERLLLLDTKGEGGWSAAQ